MNRHDVRQKSIELQRALRSALVRLGVAQTELGNVEAEIKILKTKCPHPEFEKGQCKDCSWSPLENWGSGIE